MAESQRKGLSNPLDLSHHLSRTTKNRHLSSVKDFYKYFDIPGIGNLAGGIERLEQKVRSR
jgi:site-specific recombinase XerD